jgi:N-glycosylase/DNA lyase
MPTLKLSLKTPPHYSLRETVRAHGWYQLAPFQWDEKSETLRFAFLSCGESVDVTVRQQRQLSVALESHRRLNGATRKVTVAGVRRALDLDSDVSGLLSVAKSAGAQYERMIRSGAGRRLRAPSLWEDAAKTLFTTNCTWSLTLSMSKAACAGKFSKCAPSGNFPFPMPDAIASADAARLKSMLPVGYRAPFLRALARRFSDEPHLGNLESAETQHEQAYETINALDGFGPYATGHLMMMAGHYRHIPIDTVATTFVREAFGARKAQSFIQRRYAKWGNYKFWGYRFDQLLYWYGK